MKLNINRKPNFLKDNRKKLNVQTNQCSRYWCLVCCSSSFQNTKKGTYTRVLLWQETKIKKNKKSFTKDPNFNKALFDQLLIKLWEGLQILSLEILQIWDLGKFVSKFWFLREIEFKNDY